VIVCDFDFVDIVLLPTKTNSILLIDPNAMLTFSVPTQPLQPVPWWDPQLREVLYAVQLIQFAPNHRPQSLWASPSRSAAIYTEK
jgi:hypothetical protein